MDLADVERLRDRHPAWRLLRAGNAPLVLAFLGRFFVDANNGATSASVLAAALDDELYELNAGAPDAPRYPKPATDYLEDWAHPDAGWLRRFYPLGSDEVHYDATPAFNKAYAWVIGLGVRAFVGTESRLHTVVELLRQIVYGAETDPKVRLAELQRRRDAIDREIAEVEAGNLAVLGPTSLRDRYQQFVATARELLSDFREVEENFREPGPRRPRADRSLGGQQGRSARRAGRKPRRHRAPTRAEASRRSTTSCSRARGRTS